VQPPSETVVLGGSATFCDYSTGGTPPYTYCWQFPSLTGGCIGTGDCLTIDPVTDGDVGTYSLIVTDAHNCMDTCYAVLDTFPSFTCRITHDFDGVCVHNDSYAEVEALGGVPPYTYCWQQEPYSGGCIDIDTRIDITGARPADAGMYRVTITDDIGQTAECFSELVVHPLPLCDVQPPSQTAILGGSATFCDYSTGGTTPYTYCWQFPSLTGGCIGTGDCLTIDPVTGGGVGTYSLIVTDAHNCMDTCYAVLDTFPSLWCRITHDFDSVCVHNDSYGEVEALGGVPPYTYCWQQEPYSGGCIDIDTRIDITGARPADAGMYRVTITDDVGQTVECFSELVVWPLPLCDLPDDPVEVCVHNDVSICDATSGGTPPYTYCWQFPSLTGGCIGTGDCLNFTGATPADAGIYSLIVTDDNDCKDTCYVEVVVNPQPACSLACPEPLPRCNTSGNTFTAASLTGTIVDYDWDLTSSDGSWTLDSGDGTPTITYTAGNAGVEGCFQLIITDEKGCMDTCNVCCNCESGVYCTYTMGGWGNTCPEPQVSNMMSTQPGCIRDHYFADVYGSGGVWIGDPDGDDADGFYAAHWTSATAVRDFLPSGGPSEPLTGDVTYNAGVARGTNTLIGQILALTLNVDYSCAGIFDLLGLDPDGVGCLLDADIPMDCAGGFTHIDNMTVGEFLAFADSVVGGEDVLGSMTYSDVTYVASCLNEYFHDCRAPAPTPTAPEGEAPTDDPMVRPETPPVVDIPKEFAVSGYPNPAGPSATIRYALPVNSRVTIEVFDVQGRSVITLLDQDMPAGYHSVVWEGTDNMGKRAASGVYFCRVQCCDGKEIMKKVIKVQ
jgi:hypothetical protein